LEHLVQSGLVRKRLSEIFIGPSFSKYLQHVASRFASCDFDPILARSTDEVDKRTDNLRCRAAYELPKPASLQCGIQSFRGGGREKARQASGSAASGL